MQGESSTSRARQQHMFLLHVRRVMLLECTVGRWDGRTVNLGLDAIKRGSGENLMKDQTRGNIACDALPVSAELRGQRSLL